MSNWNSADKIKYSDDMKSLTYNGNIYTEFDVSKHFYPFLSDSSSNRKVYSIGKDYVADTRDENLCFIYNDGGVLGNTCYKRNDIDIPQLIKDPEKVDRIIMSTSSGDYYIDNKSDISLLIEYFSSEKIVSLGKGNYTNEIPTENISFYAVSGYYGGEFSLEQDLIVFWGKEKIIKNNEQELFLPESIVDVISRTFESANKNNKTD